MKKRLLCIAAVLFIGSTLLVSCTKSDNAETKGTIETMTENAGKEMADYITSPIEKARIAREQIEGNYRDMEENLEKQ